MLDFFLVLGLIPGTNFYLTFNEIMLGVLGVASVYYVYHHQQESKEKLNQIIEYSQLHGFSFPISQQPVHPASTITRPKLFVLSIASKLGRTT